MVFHIITMLFLIVVRIFLNLAIPKTIEDYMSVVAMQPQKGYKIMEEWKNWFANGPKFDNYQ